MTKGAAVLASGLSLEASMFSLRVVPSLLLLCAAAVSYGFNSEEHKLVTDLGVSQVSVDPSITLPGGTRFEIATFNTVLSEFKSAKEKAAGFQTNNPADFASTKKGPQDNSYWGPGFGQGEYNKRLWIPDVGLGGQRLMVTSHLTAQPSAFSLGTLSALYGDYRRSVYCQGAACYLTQSDRLKSATPFNDYEKPGTMFFKRGYDCFGGVINCGWEPAEMPAEDYLRHIGSGLVPPFMAALNVAANEDDYGEAGWWGDEMMRVAAMNDWHFSNGAVAWYVGMHRMAVLAAARAAREPREWNRALHYEANALHSLVDLFAFGHMVTSRDATAWGVVEANSEGNSATATWMKRVLEMGGAQRVARTCGGSACMKLEFLPELPEARDLAAPRADFMRTYLSSVNGLFWASWSNKERLEHDGFNLLGACARNLNGDAFRVTGDGELRSDDMRRPQCGPRGVSGLEAISAAVRASVQALFDAHVAVVRGEKTAEELVASGSPSFAALRRIPVFVDQDFAATVDGATGGLRFNGRWASYAKAVDAFSGANALPADWASCQLPYMGAGIAAPLPNQPRCTELSLILQPGQPQVVAPGQTIAFTVRGGADGARASQLPHYRWSLKRAGSRGSITSAGLYTAGTLGESTDEVLVTDSEGRAASVIVTVAPALSSDASSLASEPAPTSATGEGCSCGHVDASFPFGLGLLLTLVARRRRARAVR